MTGASAFLWGKLPTHGDFVGRGIEGDSRDELDLWLAAGMDEARAAFGKDFDDHYDEAPPWRFRWRAGEAWIAGALVPSMDRVGRRYPILLGGRAADAAASEKLAAAAEEMIYRAFEEAMNADELIAAASDLSSAPQPPGQDDGEAPVPDEDGWWTLGGVLYPPAMLTGARPSGLWQSILAREGWFA